MNIKIDTSWNSVAINVVTESDETALMICKTMLQLETEFKVSFTDEPANDSYTIVKMICG